MLDLWSVQLPFSVALGFVATMGYMVSLWHRPSNDTTPLL
jgi:hypothetical protein